MSQPTQSVRAPARAPDYLSTADVAALLQLSPATVRRLVKAGKLPPPVTGGRRSPRWSRRQVEAFLEREAP